MTDKQATDKQAARISVLEAQNKEYKRWFDGEGVQSPATTAAEMFGLLNKQAARIQALESELERVKGVQS